MLFFDAHAHCIANQNGGLIIGLDGRVKHPKSLDNKGALAVHSPDKNFWSAYYITKELLPCEHPILKFHPKIEGYSYLDVFSHIQECHPKICVFDTLAQPFWSLTDYWKLTVAFPEIQFLFSHAGGYFAMDFLSLAHSQSNAWLDFSASQAWFAGSEGGAILEPVVQSMEYAIHHSALGKKVLFASDVPFFNQDLSVRFWLKKKAPKRFFRDNFCSLIDVAKLV